MLINNFCLCSTLSPPNLSYYRTSGNSLSTLLLSHWRIIAEPQTHWKNNKIILHFAFLQTNTKVFLQQSSVFAFNIHYLKEMDYWEMSTFVFNSLYDNALDFFKELIYLCSRTHKKYLRKIWWICYFYQPFTLITCAIILGLFIHLKSLFASYGDSSF